MSDKALKKVKDTKVVKKVAESSGKKGLFGAAFGALKNGFKSIPHVDKLKYLTPTYPLKVLIDKKMTHYGVLYCFAVGAVVIKLLLVVKGNIDESAREKSLNKAAVMTVKRQNAKKRRLHEYADRQEALGNTEVAVDARHRADAIVVKE